ncbi:hypothetical protein O1611_g10296 [Lasiodiplodia mahajangana]|uniref:Uncharacterized protein n=1 Tax=Lasiodiplodia mahajangana TaxID=1108764 RepID=A0ACC2IZW4_9PEZI|nr:hypothetical protein O1611_g10296 [Lasiodiplodia mahajangana]
MSKKEDAAQQNPTAPVDDDEPDEWDKRIFSTGCAGSLPVDYLDENANLTDCYWKKKDWRACKKEMEIFRACWKKHNNDERTSTKDNTDDREKLN